MNFYILLSMPTTQSMKLTITALLSCLILSFQLCAQEEEEHNHDDMPSTKEALGFIEKKFPAAYKELKSIETSDKAMYQQAVNRCVTNYADYLEMLKADPKGAEALLTMYVTEYEARQLFKKKADKEAYRELAKRHIEASYEYEAANLRVMQAEITQELETIKANKEKMDDEVDTLLDSFLNQNYNPYDADNDLGDTGTYVD
ncbi:hypothetical protein [Persicirhabdus sediminis]|nr:hypothetical protein [Persicirhabdus sediminis]